MKKILAEISTAASRVAKDKNLKFSKVPTSQEVRENRFFQNVKEGWFATDEADEHTFNYAFQRINFRSSMGVISFKPSKNSGVIDDVCFHFSEDIGLVWGYPPHADSCFTPCDIN